jgi:hypothetical protein
MTPESWLVRPEEQNLHFVAEHIKQCVILKATVESSAGVGGLAKAPWFIAKHLEVVEDRMDWLRQFPPIDQLDPDKAKLAVWTHDLGRVMGWDYSHHQISAQVTRALLLNNGIDSQIADDVFDANLRHRAKKGLMPQSLLGQAIASADALSHFDGCEEQSVDFFLQRQGFWHLIWEDKLMKGQNQELIIKGSLEKIQRDATSKQFFPESKARAQKEAKFLVDNANVIIDSISLNLSL